MISQFQLKIRNAIQRILDDLFCKFYLSMQTGSNSLNEFDLVRDNAGFGKIAEPLAVQGLIPEIFAVPLPADGAVFDYRPAGKASRRGQYLTAGSYKQISAAVNPAIQQRC